MMRRACGRSHKRAKVGMRDIWYTVIPQLPVGHLLNESGQCASIDLKSRAIHMVGCVAIKRRSVNAVQGLKLKNKLRCIP